MSDAIGTTNVRRSADSLEKQPVFEGYSKVVLKVSDELEYVAGDDSGRTFTTSSPWGNQETANRILSKIKGFQYQSYTASNAYIDPAAEIGDGVTIGKLYSGIFSKDVSHGPLYTADIAAPGEKKIDYKYPYKSTQERKVSREMRNLTSELRIQADRIAAEVADRKSQSEEFIALFEVQARQISAKVSQTGGSPQSFEWQHLSDHVSYIATNKEVFRVDKNGAKVYGVIEATEGGKIGGFNIMRDYLSYNNQTWGGTNSRGIYAGPQGIQCGPAGRGVQITPDGFLDAESGNFRGSVNAGNIQYGESSGYFSGQGLSAGSVYGGYGGAISGGSLSTYNMAGGIKTSLGYADYSNGVYGGWNTAEYTKVRNLFVTHEMTFKDSLISKKSMYIDGPDGNPVFIKYLSWG